jgi:putative transcriptional regulator
VAPGVLLVAPPRDDSVSAGVFDQSVVLVVDREPNGITIGLCLNRPLEQTKVIDSSALALLFVPEPDAPAFWGGPMGTDPAILAQFSAVDGLEWFHLPLEQLRPFPLPDVGIIAVAEHPSPFEDRIQRSRLFVGLCVWGRGQLEREIGNGGWQLTHARADDIFSTRPEDLWSELVTSG